MSDPIDIKTKKILQNPKENKFDRALILESLEENIVENWSIWSKFQQEWCGRAFRTFRDYDKYLVLIYLIRQIFEKLALKFQYSSLEDFYSREEIIIEKINLIQISNELNIPKETIRRKINEFQSEGILKRTGKKIILSKSILSLQKPVESINSLSRFIEKESNIIFKDHNQKWFGDPLKFDQIKESIEKYFSVIWLRFFKLQIPFLIRHRDLFRDLETWNVWGVVAVHHQAALMKMRKNSIIQHDINPTMYYKHVLEFKPSHGINASSIADITNIPRATIIRKLKWLIKNGLIKKTKMAEYFISSKGKKNKIIQENMTLNQSLVVEFLTDVLDIMKNSELKI